MSKQSGVAKLIRQAKLIIWDEASMAKRQTTETVGRSFRDIMDVNVPFGGKIQFTTNMSTREYPNFSNFLLRVGNGDEQTVKDNLLRPPKQIVVKHNSDERAEECLIREIFPSLHQNSSSAQFITERAILASRNEYVDQLNEMLIAKFPGESKIFISFDSAEDDTNNYYH
ncbi:uncharacterized protein LOC142172078 [Nicotiana tabacum]|uniref:Uncharacterized protein LOC142172078 n=1 Tax=Nicotiana tabacum TaxID=4097 RepID=A0AC58T3Y7_TOBAC